MKRCLLLAATLAASPVFAQQMEPGEWQFNSTISAPMFPKPQTTTFTHCIKKEDIDNPERWMGKKPDNDCKVTIGARSGNTQPYEISCPKAGMNGKGTVRYAGASVESDMEMTGEVQGRKFDMRTRTSGKRLGACKS